MDVEAPFLEQLFAAGLLYDTGVDGLYGRSGKFEHVTDAVGRLIDRLGAADGAEIMRFPPGSNRVEFERSGYLNGFPHLAGTIHCFCGNEAEHRNVMRCVGEGADWTGAQRVTDIVLTPAACYPVYPILAGRGPLPEPGALVNVASYCFRREPSTDPARQQMFRMHEYVRLGREDQVLAFRQDWLGRVQAMATELGLPHRVEVANDPFFGRVGRIMAQSQRDQELKFELLVPVDSREAPTACVSFNYHRDHFAHAWPLRVRDGSKAHSGCIGFGVERLALALFRHHGLSAAAWPEATRAALWPVS